MRYHQGTADSPGITLLRVGAQCDRDSPRLPRLSRRKHDTAIIYGLRVFILIVACLACACVRVPRSSEPLPSDVYIWQRLWTPAVSGAVTAQGKSFQTLVVLCAEINLRTDPPKIVRPKYDARALLKSGRPVGLAIRIDPYPGPFESNDTKIQSVIELLNEQLTAAKNRGIQPDEVHIDFDCAEAKLDGYLTWLRSIRKALAPVKVIPTTLPSWLDRNEFAAIAKECGGFVLQVHSVAPPRHPSDVGRLTSEKSAIRWVEKAARIGAPFRVALPTYTYLVAFDPGGNIRGVSAEGPSSQWPADYQVFRWEAAPEELAALVAKWNREHPTTLSGIIWYRMPVPGDEYNWSWKTLVKVMSGQPPTRRVSVQTSEGQTVDLSVVNEGEADEPLPEIITASWTGSPAVATDALNSYDVGTDSDGSRQRAVFKRKAAAALSRLPPGVRRNIGWIRCDTPPEIRVSIGPGPVAGTPERFAPPHPTVRPGDGIR